MNYKIELINGKGVVVRSINVTAKDENNLHSYAINELSHTRANKYKITKLD